VAIRSRRRRWQRVVDARREARAALGRDPAAPHTYDPPPKRKTEPAPEPAIKPLTRYPWERTEYVLTFGEAAARLGVSGGDLEAMIEALPTGFTWTIPTSEVERLERKSA
jgi:hypothetical protein